MKITGFIFGNGKVASLIQGAGRASVRFLLLCWVLLFGLCWCFWQGGTAEATQPRWKNPAGAQVKVLRDFDKPAQKWQAGHRGVDLYLAHQEIKAPEEGVISFSGKVVDRTVITITHPDGHKSSFEPVTKPLPRGTKVKAGQVIARVDSSINHCPTTCIHWGVREGTNDSEEYVNPLIFLGLEDPSILLPVGEDFSA